MNLDFVRTRDTPQLVAAAGLGRTQQGDRAGTDGRGGPALVFVVERDPHLLLSLERLFASAGLDTVASMSGAKLLRQPFPVVASCLVLGMGVRCESGFVLHAALKARGNDIPVIFAASDGDVHMSVRAMKAGAVDFLLRPFGEQDMLDAVFSALCRDRARRTALCSRMGIEARHASLTRREREVFRMVTDGLLNKQIAGRLGVSEITVKFHRGSVMRKMGARTLVHLVRMADEMGPTGPSAVQPPCMKPGNKAMPPSTNRVAPTMKSQ